MTATATKVKRRAARPAVALTVEPVLLDADAAGAVCGVSGRTWRRWSAQGLTPRPLRIGRRVRWRLDEIRSWASCGAPPRVRWEQMTRPTSPGNPGRLRQVEANGEAIA